MAEISPETHSPHQSGRAFIPLKGLQRWLPLVLTLSYLSTLFGLFLAWPINWQIFHEADWQRLIAYVVASYAFLASGYALATGPVRRVAEPMRWTPYIIVAGAIAGFILLFPASQIYTSRWPWEVLSVVDQQGDAYRSFQEQLQETSGQRGLIAFVRAIFAPLTFAVLPLGLLYWAHLTWIQRGFVGLAIVTTILFSLLRGTDREFADLLIVGGATFLIILARSRAEASKWVSTLVRRYWPILIGGLAFLFVALSLYSDRKSERLGSLETRTAACINDSNICADIEAPLIAWMPIETRFAVSIFILSSASGFYGLEIAMEKDFEPTWGLGHSPAILSIYELFTEDDSIRRRTYTYRNAFDGWPEQNYWSTLMTWLANDVGFGGALVLLLGLGWLFGRSWRAATVGRSDPAAIMFCAVMISVFYLTANNQLLGSYDGYFVVAFWGFAWLREKRRPVAADVRY